MKISGRYGFLSRQAKMNATISIPAALLLAASLFASLSSRAEVQGIIGGDPVPPSKAGYSTQSIIESGQRGGRLYPTGTNFTYDYNKEMGDAMELWNAHRWTNAVAALTAIYTNHPDSPWADECEMHLGCYSRYNNEIDDAETHFLNVLQRTPSNDDIRSKVLLHLPDVYYRSGRFGAARAALRILAEMPQPWQRRQFLENWDFLYFNTIASDDSNRLCGAKAVALALAASKSGHPDQPLGNISLHEVYGSHPWSMKPSGNPEGYSLDELAGLSGGVARRIKYDDLVNNARPGSPIIVYLAPPAEPKLFERLRRGKPVYYKKPSGHFLVVERADKNLLIVLDPDGGRQIWAKSRLMYRWKNLALLLPGQNFGMGAGVGAGEAASARGGCCGMPPPAQSGGDPCTDANGPAGAMGGCAPCRGKGAPVYKFVTANRNLILEDTPIWYPDTFNGPGMSLRLTYNRVDALDGAVYTNVNYFPFGNKWQCNFTPFMRSAPDGGINLVLDDGRYETFTQTGSVSGHESYTPESPQNWNSLTNNSNIYLYTYDSDKSTLGLGYYGFTISYLWDRYNFGVKYSSPAMYSSSNVVDASGRRWTFKSNASGYVTNITDMIGRSCSFAYSTNGNLIAITDMGGNTTTIGYDANNWPTNMMYPSGSSIIFSYASGANMGPPYDATNTVLQYTNGQTIATNALLAFSNSNYVAGYTNGQILSVLLADTNGSFISTAYPLKYTNSQFFSINVNRTNANIVTNALLLLTDVVNNPFPAFRARAVDSLNRTNEMFYKAFNGGGPITVTDKAGNQWAYLSDRGIPYAKTTYDAVNSAASTNQWAVTGHQYESRTYDLRGNLLKRQYATRANPVLIGTAINTVSTNDLEIDYLYDSARTDKYVVSATVVTNGVVAGVWSNKVDNNGNVLWHQDAMGNVTAAAYDSNDNLLAITNALGKSIYMAYDSPTNDAHLLQMTDARGNSVSWEYNPSNGFNTRVSFPDATYIVRTPDSIGRLQSLTEMPTGWTLSFYYDSLDRVTKVVFPDGTAATNTYSCCGLQSSADRLGHATSYGYDAAQRLASITNAAGNVIGLNYNANDDVSAISVGMGGGVTNSVQFNYFSTNGFIRLESRVSPMGKINNAYQYSFLGWLTNRTDGLQQQTPYSYDGLGRLTRITYPNNNSTVISYDALGRATTMTNLVCGETYSYDAVSQMTNDTVSLNVSGFTAVTYRISRSYDAAGNQTGMTLSGLAGFTNVISTAYAFDMMNRVTLVSNVNAWAGYAVDEAGRLKTKTYGNGDVTSFGYDTESRMTSMMTSNGASPVQGWNYSYNAGGLITCISNGVDVWNYTYDAVNRLTREQGASTDTSWAYDPAGNCQTNTSQFATNVWSFDADNQMLKCLTGLSTSAPPVTVTGSVLGGTNNVKWYNSWARTGSLSNRVSTSDGSFSIAGVPVSWGSNAVAVTVRDVSGNVATQTVGFTMRIPPALSTNKYDANGCLVTNIAGGVTNVFSYDYEKRLTQAKSNGTVVLQCWYDGAGRRVAKKEVTGGVTNAFMYVYDGMSVLAVLNQSGQMIESYTRGAGIGGDVGSIVAATHYSGSFTNGTFYFHGNHRGDVTAVRNGTNTVATYDYAAFGTSRSSSGNYNSRFRFSSKELDASTGFYHFGFRYYIPSAQRWLTPDPIHEAGGINLYEFCGDDPVNTVDIDGLRRSWWRKGFDALSDFEAGAGDIISFGITKIIRDSFPDYYSTDYCSYSYKGGEAAGFAWGLAIGGAGAAAKTAGQLGREGESAVRAAYDIGEKPSQTILMNGRARIPDGINRLTKTLSEVKNVKRLSFTRQLRDYLEYSQSQGLRFDLYTRSSTQLSGPLLDAIDAGLINRIFIP